MTSDARGTHGYRAPELLREIPNSGLSVGCAIDIWGLGCILFELLFREKAFATDYETQRYAIAMLRGLSAPPSPVARARRLITLDDEQTFGITELINSTLEVEPDKRPDASILLARFDIPQPHEIVSSPPGHGPSSIESASTVTDSDTSMSPSASLLIRRPTESKHFECPC
jgi:serine/threonine protein kinase